MDDRSDLTQQRTLAMWRRTEPPTPPVAAAAAVEDATPNPRAVWLLLALVAALLFGVLGYGAGYAVGTGSAHAPSARAIVQPSSTVQRPWREVWRHSGAGHELVTPPALTPQDSPRLLLAWSCGTSAAAATISVSLSQPATDTARAFSLASVTCPGYGNVAVTVGSDIVRDTLHYGAYGLVIDAPDHAPWVVTVARESEKFHG